MTGGPGILRRIDIEDQAVRQLVSVVAVLLALAAALFLPGLGALYPAWMWTGVIGTIALLACRFVRWRSLPPDVAVVVPLLSLLFIGFFRVGTGGSYSLFSSLVVIPIVWIASMPGRRYAIIAMAATLGAMSMPYVLMTERIENGQLLRVVFSTLVFGLVGFVVNELSSRATTRFERTRSLAEERARLLDRATATQLSLSAAAAELRTSQAFLNSIWESTIHEMVAVTDLDGRIVAWGPGSVTMLGFERAEVEGVRQFTDLISSDDVDAHELVTSVIDRTTGDGVVDDVSLITATGDRVPVRLSYATRLDGDGEVIGQIFIALDMSAERDAARVKDEFVGMISHELRTPLSSILGYLELVRDDDADLSADQRRFLDVAERNAHRLLALVGDLLFVAQVDAGRIPIEVQDVDLRELVSNSADSIAPVAANAGVDVTIAAPPTPMVMRGDPGRLGQALDNLVSNAVKFTKPGGVVSISARRDGDDAVLSVSDTGIGISADEVERLFTRFFRATTATREAIRGVGLGLNITKAIVTAHRGTLSASSVEGEGSVFEIRLPLDQDAPVANPT